MWHGQVAWLARAWRPWGSSPSPAGTFLAVFQRLLDSTVTGVKGIFIERRDLEAVQMDLSQTPDNGVELGRRNQRASPPCMFP